MDKNIKNRKKIWIKNIKNRRKKYEEKTSDLPCKLPPKAPGFAPTTAIQEINLFLDRTKQTGGRRLKQIKKFKKSAIQEINLFRDRPGKKHPIN